MADITHNDQSEFRTRDSTPVTTEDIRPATEPLHDSSSNGLTHQMTRDSQFSLSVAYTRSSMPDRQPRISVVLCTYNGGNFLEEQLQSIYRQTLKPDEIIASDDSSSDNTWAILTSHAARDGRIRIVRRSPNVGSQRNFWDAFALATGDYIAPCDQDDVWHPDKLYRLIQHIGDASLSYCNSLLVDARGTPTGQLLSDHRRMHYGNDPTYYVADNSVSGHACIFRRDLLNNAPYPGLVTYDRWIAILAANQNGITYLDEPLVRFRRHPTTVTEMGFKKPRHRGLQPWLCRIRKAIEMPHIRNTLEQCALLPAPRRPDLESLRAAWRRRELQWVSLELPYLALRFRHKLFGRPHMPLRTLVIRLGSLLIGGRLSGLLPRIV